MVKVGEGERADLSMEERSTERETRPIREKNKNHLRGGKKFSEKKKRFRQAQRKGIFHNEIKRGWKAGDGEENLGEKGRISSLRDRRREKLFPQNGIDVKKKSSLRQGYLCESRKDLLPGSKPSFSGEGALAPKAEPIPFGLQETENLKGAPGDRGKNISIVKSHLLSVERKAFLVREGPGD